MVNQSIDLPRAVNARWQTSTSRKITRRLVIEGTLTLETPASFSNGETVGTEIVILEDALEKRPLIPGASLAGALRHYLLTREFGYRSRDQSDEKQKSLVKQLFGEALANDDPNRMESHVIVADALGGADSRQTIREGVKIDGRTRTADDGMLFSTQVWEAGTIFALRFELVLRKEDKDNYNHSELMAGFAVALNALGNGEIPLGGRKSRGYGRVKVSDWQVSDYRLDNPQALSAWLLGQHLDNETEQFFKHITKHAEDIPDKRQFVRIDAEMRLVDTLLIRSDSDFADNEHLTTNDARPVLSGTSLAGAMRARALKIANTINTPHAQLLIDDLFGQHGADGNTDDLTASRVRVEEHPIAGGKFDYIQNRVKIDRFTGGSFETALFDERPLFADENTRVRVCFEFHYPADATLQATLDAEVGLLLLVLKDLWTQDLPFGGEASIGRGRLQGLRAEMKFQFTGEPEHTVFKLNSDGLENYNPQVLEGFQSYIDTLLNYTVNRDQS